MAVAGPTLRVGILDDHALFLELLADSLNAQSDITVTATADRVAEGRLKFVASQLDVVILDIELPDGNGLGFAVALRRANPQLGVVLLSAKDMLNLVDHIPASERIGWSYLSKSSTRSIEVLAGVVRASARGESVIDPALQSRAYSRSRSKLSQLTSRQFEVLRAVASGYSNQGIAELLGIAANSVGNHLIGIYAALGIPDGKNARVAAVLAFLHDQSTQYDDVFSTTP